MVHEQHILDSVFNYLVSCYTPYENKEKGLKCMGDVAAPQLQWQHRKRLSKTHPIDFSETPEPFLFS